jgi:glutaredoxin
MDYNMGVELLLFTLDGCGHCKTFKERLRSETIPFREIEVSKNKQIWNQVVGQTQNEYLPAFYIKREGSDNGPFYCPDKDFKTDDEAINIIRKYIPKEKGVN